MLPHHTTDVRNRCEGYPPEVLIEDAAHAIVEHKIAADAPVAAEVDNVRMNNVPFYGAVHEALPIRQ